MIRRALVLAQAVVALVSTSAPALWAQAPTSVADSVRADSVLEARTSELAAELRCAVCQGISIQESPSALAREMRDIVKEQLRDGRTPAEVKAYFVSKYGEWVLLEPPARGLNLMIYVLPGVLLLGGLVFIGVMVRRWTTAPAVEPPSDAVR